MSTLSASKSIRTITNEESLLIGITFRVIHYCTVRKTFTHCCIYSNTEILFRYLKLSFHVNFIYFTLEIEKAISQIYLNISYTVTHIQPIVNIIYT